MKKIYLLLVLGFMIFTVSSKVAFAAEALSSPAIELGCPCGFTQVRASHILVKTREQAMKIRQEIISGKSFEQAAKEYSMCPSKDEGGDLGYFCRGMMVPEFDEAAFAMPVRKLSEPIRTEFGWHLILVTDKK